MKNRPGPYPDAEGVNMAVLAFFLLPCVLIWLIVQGLARATQYLVYDAPLAGIVVGTLFLMYWLSLGSAIALAARAGRRTIRVIWGVGAYGAALLVLYVGLHVFKRHDVAFTNLPQEFWRQNGFWMFLDAPPLPLGPILIVGAVCFLVYICRVLDALDMSPLTDVYDAIVGRRRGPASKARGEASSLLRDIIGMPKYAWDLFTEPWRAEPPKPAEPKLPPRTRATKRVPARAPWEEDPDFL